jgi:hypothetical protein
LVPLVPPLPPAPLVPPVPGTYEQTPALPPSVETQVRLNGSGQKRSQAGVGVTQPAVRQLFSIAVSAAVSVTKVGQEHPDRLPLTVCWHWPLAPT